MRRLYGTARQENRRQLRVPMPAPPPRTVRVGAVLSEGLDVGPVHGIELVVIRTVAGLRDQVGADLNVAVLDACAHEALLREALLLTRAPEGDELGDATRPVVVAGSLPRELARLALHSSCIAFPAQLDTVELAFVLEQCRPLALAHSARSARHSVHWASGALGAWVSACRPDIPFTPRQRTIVALAALGFQRAQIAASLRIEVRTVDFHIGGVLAHAGRASLDDVVDPLRELLRHSAVTTAPTDSQTPPLGVRRPAMFQRAPVPVGAANHTGRLNSHQPRQ